MTLKVKDALDNFDVATIPCGAPIAWYTGKDEQPKDDGPAIVCCYVSCGFDNGYELYLARYSVEDKSWELIVSMFGDPVPTEGVAKVIAWTDIPHPKEGSVLFNEA